MGEERVRRRRHRDPRIGHDELRHGDVQRPLDDERNGAACDRLAGEVVPVDIRPRHAEEERSRHDRPRVVGEVAHLDRSPPDHVDRPDRGDEALQIHHRPASLPRGAAASGVVGDDETKVAALTSPARAERRDARRS